MRIPIEYRYLKVLPFKFIYHVRTFISRKNRPSITMVWNGIDPNKNSGIQRFSHLDIPIEYQNLTGMTILKPTGRFSDTNIDVDNRCHVFTYIPDQHCFQPRGHQSFPGWIFLLGQDGHNYIRFSLLEVVKNNAHSGFCS